MLRSTPILCLALMLPTAAGAQNDVSFVSTLGSDSNACTFAAPCRTFAGGTGALGKTVEGGRIQVLTTGTYPTPVITKSITIAAEGVAPIFTAFGAAIAIVINAPGKTVILDGFTITGAVSTGVQIDGARHVSLRNCLINGMNSPGRSAVRLATSEATTVKISDCTFVNNSAGVHVRSTGLAQRAFLDRVRFAGPNSGGIIVDGPKAFVRLNQSAIWFRDEEITVLNGGRVESFGNNAISVVPDTVIDLN